MRAALRRRYGHAEAVASHHLHCDMKQSCPDAVSHVDNKGFLYCTKHGVQRRANGTPCRQLRPSEIQKLVRGETIRYR